MRTRFRPTTVQAQGLDTIAKAENRSRAAIIRSAIDDYIARSRKTEFDKAFGLWAGKGVDGLVYQEKLRDW